MKRAIGVAIALGISHAFASDNPEKILYEKWKKKMEALHLEAKLQAKNESKNQKETEISIRNRLDVNGDGLVEPWEAAKIRRGKAGEIHYPDPKDQERLQETQKLREKFQEEHKKSLKNQAKN